MPAAYVAIHLALTVLAGWLALRLPGRTTLSRVLAVLLLALVGAGLLLERRPDVAWSALLLRWPDLVFFTNYFLPGIAVLVAVLWRASADRPARARAVSLAVPAVAVALWSYAWYFEPLPEGLAGTVDPKGYCRQTTDDSCSAAAAAMLLQGRGIAATEREMAELCLTRAGKGTPTLGLFRGLAVKGGTVGYAPRLVFAGSAAGLHALRAPSILLIGLRPGAPPEVAARMSDYGWTPGLRHSVVALSADPAGKWIEIADPSYGRERWPTGDIEHIWDGRALILALILAPGR